MKRKRLVIAQITVFAIMVAATAAAQDCMFTVSGTTMTLTNDCVASAPITIPAGFTLNGNKHLITAPDSGGGVFTQGVINNGGTVAHVKNLLIETVPAGACGSYTSTAIWFDSASGSITDSTLINTGVSNCVGGNSGITLVSPVNVTVSGNRIYNTKGAPLNITCSTWPNCSGGTVNVTGNEFLTSYCCNPLVYLSGVGGSFTGNMMTASLIYGTAIEMDNTATGFKVASNIINLGAGAASQYGIYVDSDNAVITGNRIFNAGVNEGSAVGIYNRGATDPKTNKITGNEIRCYGTPTFQVTGQNVFLTCPW
jgi:hypothetical protein